MLAAHLDEVGLIITEQIGVADGSGGAFARFEFLGGVDVRVALGKRVLVGELRIPAVISPGKAWHLAASAERDRVPAASELVLDLLGYNASADGGNPLIGEFAAFDSEFVLFGDGFVKAKAIDDRAGCAVLLKLLQSEGFNRDVYYVFTVQEEVGTRGAAAVANRLKPETVIVVESTTAADYPVRSETDAVCRLGKGAVLPFMDGGAIYDAKLWQKVCNLADKHNIPWQTKHRVAGGTDARAFQQAAYGAKVAAISLATRNIHSPSCVAKLSDLDAVLSLCRVAAEEL